MNKLYRDLCKVKALLVAGWTQGKDVNEPGRTCLFMAVENVEPFIVRKPRDAHHAIYDELKRIGWVSGMVEFNDEPGRTKAEVIDVVQRAANRAGGVDA